MIRWTTAALLAVSLQLCIPMSGPHAAEPPVIRVPTSDAEMATAIAKARRTLPEFWEKQAHPGPRERGFALKVAIADGEEEEHFWLVDVKRDARSMSGVIDNTPALVRNVKAGERVEFTEEQISDWLFMRNGKMVGNETMRPLLKRMPAAHAERFRALYETP